MTQKLIKNLDFSKVLEMESLVDYQEGRVISLTISQGKALSITLFAFDKEEEISAHASPGDAMVYVLDGLVKITIGEESFQVGKGQVIVMPAGIPHALYAVEKFKMLLIVVFDQGN